MSTLFYKTFFLVLFINILLPQTAKAQNDSEIILYKKEFELEKSHITEKTYLKILLSDDDSNDYFDIHYQEGNAPKILKATIFNQKGEQVKKFKRKDFLDLNEQDGGVFVSDQKIKQLQLPQYGYPYIFEIEYTLEYQNFISLTQWSPIYYYQTPVRKAFLQVTTPKNLKLTIKSDSVFNYNQIIDKNTISRQWSYENYQPIESEYLAPPLYELIPRVTIIPDKFFYYSEGTAESWASLGNYFYQLNKGLTELTPSEKNTINLLTAGMTDRRLIIEKIYNYMQDNTRYINVRFGVGGLKPYPASYVCTNKYGDCKALTIYMKALLEHKNIESYYVPVYAGGNPIKVDPELPSSQFNHVILAVPNDQDTIWLENTAGYLPSNYLGTFTQGRKGFLIDSTKSRLVNIPPLSEDQTLNESYYEVNISDQETLEISFTKTLRSDDFELLSFLKKEKRNHSIENYIRSNTPLDNKSDIVFKVQEFDRNTPHLELKGSYQTNSFLQKIGDKWAITAHFLKLPNFDVPTKRKLPVRISSPIHQINTFTFHLKRGLLPQPLRDVKIQSEFGSFEISYKAEKEHIKATNKLLLNRQDISVDAYPSFWNFINEVKEAQAKSGIILSKSHE
ncbi:DUF3857 domain-containing protein [Roseivirga pacifica]